MEASMTADWQARSTWGILAAKLSLQLSGRRGAAGMVKDITGTASHKQTKVENIIYISSATNSIYWRGSLGIFVDKRLTRSQKWIWNDE